MIAVIFETFNLVLYLWLGSTITNLLNRSFRTLINPFLNEILKLILSLLNKKFVGLLTLMFGHSFSHFCSITCHSLTLYPREFATMWPRRSILSHLIVGRLTSSILLAAYCLATTERLKVSKPRSTNFMQLRIVSRWIFRLLSSGKFGRDLL